MKKNQEIKVLLALFTVIVATSSALEFVHRSNCPEACYCDENRHLINCGYKSLTRLPLYVPVTGHDYSVAGNRIRQVSPDSLFGLHELVSLDLSENFISELPRDLFNATPKLRILRLNNNRFEYIPEASLSRLHSLQQLFLTMNRIHSISGDTKFISPSLITLGLTGNEIAEVQDRFLDSFPQLRDLLLSQNYLTLLNMNKWSSREHGLELLDVSYNRVSRILLNDVVYREMKVLNASNNLLRLLESSWFVSMPNLSVLELCGNLIGSIENNTFVHATSLKRLALCELSFMKHIYSQSFSGLHSLEEFDLSNNYNLSSIHPDSFTNLRHLQYLNVRNNGLNTLQSPAAGNDLRDCTVYLSGIQWVCDCHLKWMYEAHVTLGSDVGQDIVCSAPPQLRGISLFEVKEFEFLCEVTERRHHPDQIVSGHISTNIMLHCPTEVDPHSVVVWTTSRGAVIHSVVFTSDSRQLPADKYPYYSVLNRGANVSEKLTDGHEVTGHFELLANGSLIVKDVSRGDTGRYMCMMVNSHENVTLVTELRLDYSYMSSVMLVSLVVGGASALALLLIAVILGTIRHIVRSCNADERKKRRSLRELLSQMRNNAQFDRLSAYRAVQMDKLSAFKSATMDQLSAFTSTRIGRLRRYKQATVSCVLHHLERMREHYSVQMDHIKESYRQNTARLRHSYITRFREGRSTSVRKQYRASVARARDYTNEQIARLREQYKQQQQYLLKLLELIDVGSCVSSSVEEECVRAESAIFDATVEFDEEARPSYASRSDDGLYASCSSLPDHCRHCTLTAIVSPSAHNLDAHDDDAGRDGCDQDVTMTLRTASAPSVRSCNLSPPSPPTEDNRMLKVHTCLASVSCHRTASSPVVCTVIDDADMKLSNDLDKRNV